jgi:hypothetical protein
VDKIAIVMGKVVDTVFHIVSHVTYLLHPVLEPPVVAFWGRADVSKEGLHGPELITDVLDIAADATDQSVLLGKEAAQLAQKRFHGGLGSAHHKLHLLCLFAFYSYNLSPVVARPPNYASMAES